MVQVTLWWCVVAVLCSSMVCLSTQQDYLDFSGSEIREILYVHNSLRQHLSQYTDNMPDLEWNDDLAQVWKDSASPCTFAHTTNDYRTNKAGFQAVGENLAASSANVGISQFLRGWGQERASYTYAPIGSPINTGVTGHYTQEIWANTTDVGCTRVACPGGTWGKSLYQKRILKSRI